MSKFSLSIRSFTPPTLPDQPSELTASDILSGWIPGSDMAATSPLSFTIQLPASRDNNSLHPATRLQISYHYQGCAEMFSPRSLTSQDLIKSASGQDLYTIHVPPSEIPRAKVNEGMTSTADVNVYAWKGEKLLGKWKIGAIEKLGLVGLKSDALSVRRKEVWDALRQEGRKSQV